MKNKTSNDKKKVFTPGLFVISQFAIKKKNPTTVFNLVEPKLQWNSNTLHGFSLFNRDFFFPVEGSYLRGQNV